MTAGSQQPNVKNGQPPLDITRPFMDDTRPSFIEGESSHPAFRASTRRFVAYTRPASPARVIPLSLCARAPKCRLEGKAIASVMLAFRAQKLSEPRRVPR
jgi:hypothetical protein